MASQRAAASDDGSAQQTDDNRDEEPCMTTLFCTQRDRSGGFGGGTAFFGLSGDTEELADWTCDRRESFDARGRLVIPDEYAQASGGGLDPCAAIATRLAVRAGDTVERTFLLGWAASPEGAHALAASAARVSPLKRKLEVRDRWDELLEATVVRTPDPLFDAMVNRWLLYQTIACRLWAKAGFYQAGGAYGYRDQLQDAMALVWAAPDMLRRQILLAASRQFPEGDVQHWWHAPTGAGVRTHFSDDLLWLPHAALRYIEASGDRACSTRACPPRGHAGPARRRGRLLRARHRQRHGERLRALRPGDRSQPDHGHARFAADGHGRLERRHEPRRPRRPGRIGVARLVPDRHRRPFRAARRGPERGRARRRLARRCARLAQRARAFRLGRRVVPTRLLRRRQRPRLGAQRGSADRPDRAGVGGAFRAAPEAHQRQAMASLEAHLVDADAGLVRLLDPPLRLAQPSAGYIQAYPPGVRENGGQYSHAGVWALMAQAARGDGDAAYRYFGYLSPAHRSRHPQRGRAYAIEPYVVAGDVYSAPPYVGRGGWSWYTGRPRGCTAPPSSRCSA
jgi:cyclic beta-1,2-glucan synthetase